jgi:20S proteasome subunit alpha 6
VSAFSLWERTKRARPTPFSPDAHTPVAAPRVHCIDLVPVAISLAPRLSPPVWWSVSFSGTHLFEAQPSGQYFEYKGMAIGARSQAGRTYLERHFESFPDLELDELIKHSLLALQETLGTGQDLSAANVAVGYVGLNGGFTILEDETIAPYVESVKRTEGAPAGDAMEQDGAAPAETGEGGAAAAMDTA